MHAVLFIHVYLRARRHTGDIDLVEVKAVNGNTVRKAV